jgi:D-glycero-D-manno-heptose 1,7-bisphosphate phosphatase
MALVILDRDGVINHDSPEFIKTPEEWIPIPGSLEAIARLCDGGFTVTVATNQSGVGRGLLDEDTLQRIHRKMIDAVRDAGGNLSSIAYCPHHPDAGCSCRKPEPGLLEALARHAGTGLDGVPCIGDSARDLEAAARCGARPILVLTGNGQRTRAEWPGAEPEVCADLSAVADLLLAELAA